mmetsp:Transcript_32471/g.68096  ORF Transcript_32471/g.68096 Transcript_32471/m.68096 type:complete len:179 (+) Transcript_32471:37-573(+)
MKYCETIKSPRVGIQRVKSGHVVAHCIDSGGARDHSNSITPSAIRRISSSSSEGRVRWHPTALRKSPPNSRRHHRDPEQHFDLSGIQTHTRGWQSSVAATVSLSRPPKMLTMIHQRPWDSILAGVSAPAQSDQGRVEPVEYELRTHHGEAGMEGRDDDGPRSHYCRDDVDVVDVAAAS